MCSKVMTSAVTNHVVSRLKADYADILTDEAPTGLLPHREVNTPFLW
jgi:hypothetical protein